MKTVLLGDLFQVGSSKRVLKSQWRPEGVPFYRGREITSLAKNGFVDNQLYIAPSLYSEHKTKSGVPGPGDIMMTAIGTIGNSYIVRSEDEFYFKDASVLWLKKKSDVISEFVNLWLQSLPFKNQLSKGNGATVDTLTIKKLQEVKIFLPALSEQRRIVEKLDEAFAAIDKAKQNTEKNLKNSQDLFQSEIEKIFKEQGNSVAIKEFAQVKGGKRIPKAEKLLSEKTEHPYIRVADFNDCGSVDLQNIRYISKKVYEQIARYKIFKEDLYISIAGTIGKTGIVPPELDGANLTENACRLVLNENVNNKYLYYFTKTNSFLDQAGLSTRTTAMPKMALIRLKEIEVPVPNMTEQLKLVEKFEILGKQTQKLQELYRNKLKMLEELRQSILKQAFEGKL